MPKIVRAVYPDYMYILTPQKAEWVFEKIAEKYKDKSAEWRVAMLMEYFLDEAKKDFGSEPKKVTYTVKVVGLGDDQTEYLLINSKDVMESYWCFSEAVHEHGIGVCMEIGFW